MMVDGGLVGGTYDEYMMMRLRSAIIEYKQRPSQI